MTPIDPRKDSAPNMQPVDTLSQILVRLDSLASDSHETRSSLKTLELGMNDLRGSRDDHGRSLNQLRDTIVEQGQRISRVETIAREAKDGTLENRRKQSETMEEFKATMAAVNASSGAVADRAEVAATKSAVIDARTVEIKSAADAHTTQLDKLEKVNETQSSQLANANTLLTSISKNMPAIIVLATLLGGVISKLLDALLEAMGHK